MPTNPSQPISFKDKIPITDHTDIAKNFNKQFTSYTPHKSNKEMRKIKRHTYKLNSDANFHILPTHTENAISQIKNTPAHVPDNISNLHLKHLGPFGLTYLTHLFNLVTTYKSQQKTTFTHRFTPPEISITC